MGIQGGPTFSRTVALDGADYWEDTTNRGGGFMRFGGPGGPGGPGGGQGPSEADRERFRQMAQRRLQGELQRYLLVWLMRTDAPMTYGGEAEAEDGKADVVEVKPEGGTPMRVFFDQKSHLPLMLTYEGAQPRMMMFRQGRGPGGAPGGNAPGGNAPAPPDPEEMRRRMAEPPKMVTFEVRFSDFKNVNGVDLAAPDVAERRRQADRGVDGQPVQGEPEPQARVVREEEQVVAVDSISARVCCRISHARKQA